MAPTLVLSNMRSSRDGSGEMLPSCSLTSKLRGVPLAARPLERSVRRFNLNESRFVHSGHRWHPGCECRCHHLARRSRRVCGYRFLLLAHRLHPGFEFRFRHSGRRLLRVYGYRFLLAAHKLRPVYECRFRRLGRRLHLGPTRWPGLRKQREEMQIGSFS